MPARAKPKRIVKPYVEEHVLAWYGENWSRHVRRMKTKDYRYPCFDCGEEGILAVEVNFVLGSRPRDLICKKCQKKREAAGYWDDYLAACRRARVRELAKLGKPNPYVKKNPPILKRKK